MSKLYVNGKDVHLVSNKCDRILAIFPHPVYANRALAWCHKKELCVIDAAQAIVHLCAKKGVPTFGRSFGKSFGQLTGYKPYKVELEHLSK